VDSSMSAKVAMPVVVTSDVKMENAIAA